MKIGGTIDKEIIIRTVSQLEAHAELKLHSPRTLPGSLITTTLNLPIGQSEQTVVAHFANPPPPVDLKRPSSPPPSNDRSRDRKNGSRGNSKDKKYPLRHQSKFPRQDAKKEQRERSPYKYTSRSASREK